MDEKAPIKMNAPETSAETEEFIRNGQKVIETAKKTDPAAADKKEDIDEKEEQDAETWRNEG